eukprot:6626947-Prymnesium_polylepis.1
MSGDFSGRAWRALSGLDPADVEGDAPSLAAAADAVLALPVDDETVGLPQQVVRALKLAQVAIQGERKRTKDAEARSGSGGDAATQRALDRAKKEAKEQAEKVRALQEQLEQTDLELQDKRDEVVELSDELERLEAAGSEGGARTRLAPSASVGKLGNEVRRVGDGRPHACGTRPGAPDPCGGMPRVR